METGLAREAVLGTVRRTFYEHFCGGEDTVEAAATVRQLNEPGLGGCWTTRWRTLRITPCAIGISMPFSRQSNRP